jgi:hypothetical protein
MSLAAVCQDEHDLLAAMCVICGIKLARNMINASVCTIYIYYAAV